MARIVVVGFLVVTGLIAQVFNVRNLETKDYRVFAVSNPTRSAVATVTGFARDDSGVWIVRYRYRAYKRTFDGSQALVPGEESGLRVGGNIQIRYFQDFPETSAYNLTWIHGPGLARSWVFLYPIIAAVSVAIIWLTRPRSTPTPNAKRPPSA